MNKALAIQIINAKDEQDVPEAWENYLFNLKNEILNTVFSSPLLKLKKKKTTEALQIEQLLFPDKISHVTRIPDSIEIDFTALRTHAFHQIQQELALAKMNLQSIQIAQGVDDGLVQLIHLAELYEHLVYNIKLEQGVPVDKKIGARELYDVMEIQDEFKRYDEKVNRKDDTSQKLNNFEKEFPGLYHEACRVYPIIKNDLLT